MNRVSKKNIAFLYEGLKASDFSEVYLFFDYDGHSNNIPKEYRGKDILKELLQLFDNETELGKLYVSYPMVEAIKEVDLESADYHRLFLSLDEIRKYKTSFFQKPSCGKYKNFNKEIWGILCDASKKRAVMIVSFKEECTYKEFIDCFGQFQIYEGEKNNYINNGGNLAILNSIPLFLLEYYEEDFWNLVIKSSEDLH